MAGTEGLFVSACLCSLQPPTELSAHQRLRFFLLSSSVFSLSPLLSWSKVHFGHIHALLLQATKIKKTNSVLSSCRWTARRQSRIPVTTGVRSFVSSGICPRLSPPELPSLQHLSAGICLTQPCYLSNICMKGSSKGTNIANVSMRSSSVTPISLSLSLSLRLGAQLPWKGKLAVETKTFFYTRL